MASREPATSEARASGVAGSSEALALSPRHEYAHLVAGANNPTLPPPFTPGTFRNYVRMAWVSEGAATHLAGQVPHMRAAVARRMREGGRPSFPPAARDALVLGGTVFDFLAREAGAGAADQLALSRSSQSALTTLESAFGRPAASIGRSWEDYLAGFAAG